MTEELNCNQNVPINQILGSSIKSASLFTLQDDLLAYAAGSGIVVCKLNKDGSTQSQRFFCVNSAKDGLNSASHPGLSGTDYFAPTSANAYLNMARKDGSLTTASSSTPEEHYHRKDAFGYPLSPIISGSGSDLHLDTSPRLENVSSSAELASPSKFKERVRSINCISISPNKTILAIGETGYHPRIALFSLAPDSSSSPFAFIYEHSFGINSISFSPDSKSFCSLGLINDGFLNIWKLSNNTTPACITLQASNKCTSVVNRVIWHENFIITLGLRIIKVWKYEQQQQQQQQQAQFNNCALKGKNVLLGPLINCNFIGGESLNGDEILVITDNSQVLLLKLNYEDLKLVVLDSSNLKKQFHSICIDYDDEKVWFAYEDEVESILISDLKEIAVKKDNLPSSPIKLNNIFGGYQSTSQASRSLIPSKVFNFDFESLLVYSEGQELAFLDKRSFSKRVIVGSLIKNLSGIKLSYSRELLVFAEDGTIKKIKEDEQSDSKSSSTSIICKLNINSNELNRNGLTSVDKLNDHTIVYGDRYGNIHIGTLKEESFLAEYQIKAHASSVNDVIFFEKEQNTYVCSISRDRMIQIFSKPKTTAGHWDILQTLPTHSANILKVHYQHSFLFVCSADRTVSIHSIKEEDTGILIVQEKIISLKNTPITMKVHEKDLIVSTSDKVLMIFDVDDKFELKRTLKLFNERINESLLVENFIVHKNHITVSSSDKSLRIFNYQSGRQISTYWGHSDTILNFSLTPSSNELISISLDGCLFKWNLITRNPSSDRSTSTSNSTSMVDSGPDPVPHYAKVTRKIMPSVVTAASSLNRTPTSSRRPSIGSPTKDGNVNEVSPSPTPKLLSAATLKRMESKTEVTSSPTKTNVNTKLKSLSSSPTKLSSSPKRASWNPAKPIMTPTHRKRMSLDNLTNTLGLLNQEKPPAQTSDISFVDNAINQINELKLTLSRANINDVDKKRLKKSIEGLLNETSLDVIQKDKDIQEQQVSSKLQDRENQLLEEYSEKLMKMFQSKLSLVEKKSPKVNKPSAEGIFRRVYSNEFHIGNSANAYDNDID